MTDRAPSAFEERLLEALRQIDVAGDFTGSEANDPESEVLRRRIDREYLACWDDGEGRYRVTLSGRRLLSATHHRGGDVLQFTGRRRDAGRRGVRGSADAS